jgi:hypothetical protein
MFTPVDTQENKARPLPDTIFYPICMTFTLKLMRCRKDHIGLIQRWPIANEHKKKAHFVPKNGIKGRINILEVKAYSSGSLMNVSDHVYIAHCSRYIRSKQVTPKAA